MDYWGDSQFDPFHQGTGGGQQIIHKVSWNPDHGAQADHKAQHFAPDWVGVVFSIGDWSILDEVEQKDENHEGGGDEDPANEPVFVDLVADHKLNTIVHAVGSPDPGNGNSLEKSTPEQ